MSTPLAICIEDLNTHSKTKFTRCVALAGRQPGLRLDGAGRVLWQNDAGASCELWVSVDERLMLYRQEGMVPVTLRRAGRSLEAPCAKAVVVIDQDEIDVGARRLRVHVHGAASTVAAPSILQPAPRARDHLLQAAKTAVVVGAVATAIGGCGPFDVRESPPAAPPRPAPEFADAAEIPPSGPISEVREDPPAAHAADDGDMGSVTVETVAEMAADR